MPTSTPRKPSLRQRRESIAIIAEILKLTGNGTTTTSIARILGVNYRNAQEHVNRLLFAGHLRNVMTERGLLNERTEKGTSFLAGLNAIKSDVDQLFR